MQDVWPTDWRGEAAAARKQSLVRGTTDEAVWRFLKRFYERFSLPAYFNVIQNKSEEQAADEKALTQLGHRGLTLSCTTSRHLTMDQAVHAHTVG